MTNLYDGPDWTPEEEKIADENMRKYHILCETVRPLLEGIKKFVEAAKQGRSNKKQRDRLLSAINKALALSKKIQHSHFDLREDNVEKLKIEILGAYEFCIRNKKYPKKSRTKLPARMGK